MAASSDPLGILMKNIDKLGERMSALFVSFDHLKVNLERISELAGRLTASFMMMAGLPRVFKSDIHRTLMWEGGRKSKGVGSHASSPEQQASLEEKWSDVWSSISKKANPLGMKMPDGSRYTPEPFKEARDITQIGPDQWVDHETAKRKQAEGSLPLPDGMPSQLDQSFILDKLAAKFGTADLAEGELSPEMEVEFDRLAAAAANASKATNKVSASMSASVFTDKDADAAESQRTSGADRHSNATRWENIAAGQLSSGPTTLAPPSRGKTTLAGNAISTKMDLRAPYEHNTVLRNNELGKKTRLTHPINELIRSHVPSLSKMSLAQSEEIWDSSDNNMSSKGKEFAGAVEGKEVTKVFTNMARAGKGFIDVSKKGLTALGSNFVTAISATNKFAQSLVPENGAHNAMLGMSVGSQLLGAASPDMFATLMGSMKLVAAEMGVSLIPAAFKLAAGLQELSSYISGMDPDLKNGIANFAAMGVALLVGTVAISKLMAALAMMASPAGLAAIAVVGLATALAMLIAELDKRNTEHLKGAEKAHRMHGGEISREEMQKSNIYKNAMNIDDDDERKAYLQQVSAAQDAKINKAKETAKGLTSEGNAGGALGAGFSRIWGSVGQGKKDDDIIAEGARADQQKAMAEHLLKREFGTDEEKAAIAKKDAKEKTAAGKDKGGAPTDKTAQGLLMSLQTGRGTPQYSSIEEAYKKVQVSALGEDDIALKMQEIANRSLEEMKKQNEILIQIKDKPGGIR